MATIGKICLDTDLIIDFKLNRPEAVGLIRRLRDSNAELATTAINLFELYYGSYRSAQWQQSLKATRETVSRLRRLDVDGATADLAASIMVKLERRGEALDIRDLLIGSAALTNGYALATGNEKHFRKIPGLLIVPY